MLRLFRARAWCLITAVVLAIGTTSTAFQELLHAGTPHDIACLPVVDVAHDAANHRVSARGDDVAAADHCVACHFARSPRLGPQWVAASGHIRETVPARPTAAIGSARAAALDNLPPRSPPRLA